MSSSSLLAGLVGGLIGAVLGGGAMLALRPAPVAAPPPTRVEMPASRDPAPVDPLRPDSSVLTPPPNFERVRELQEFDEDLRVRRRWLFLSERQALDEFGTPTNSWLSENGECWRYDEPDIETGDEIIHGKTITLVFSRGRLVQVYD